MMHFLLNKLKLYETEKKVPSDIRLSVYMEKIIKSSFSELFIQHFYNEDKTPFVISFSEKEDNLNMWSRYGNKGKGICLCFDEDELIVDNKGLLLNTVYINQNDNDKLSTIVLNQIIPNEYERYLNTSHNDKEKVISVGTMLPLLSAYIKDSTFVDEQERRFALMTHGKHELIYFRTSKLGNIIPYIKVPIPKKSLKEIIVGPCIQPECAARGLLFELNVCGIDIPISFSSVPYREI